MRTRLRFETAYDVVVCGGGMAGVAAALAAARLGQKTCLLEKTVFTGGLATTGNVLYYLPLSDHHGNQVTFGIAEELLRASIHYGPGEVAGDFKTNPERRYSGEFMSAAFILALDEVLTAAGVDLWLDTLVCAPRLSRGKLTGVEVENKSGRGLVRGKAFVDASGDADLAFRAGAPCATQLNFMSIWAVGATPEMARSLLSETGCAIAHGVFAAAGAWDDGSNQPAGIRQFSGVDAKDVSEFILTGRRLLREQYRDAQAKLGPNGRRKVFPMGLPAMANFRTTRRIEARHTLANGDAFKHFDDCVGLVAEWKRGEEVWELPYRALLPPATPGLLVAGRCIGARDDAWSVMRVIQAAAMSGEVAGVAGAMAADRGHAPDRLPVTDLQCELKKRGFLLNVRDLGLPHN